MDPEKSTETGPFPPKLPIALDPDKSTETGPWKTARTPNSGGAPTRIDSGTPNRLDSRASQGFAKRVSVYSIGKCSPTTPTSALLAINGTQDGLRRSISDVIKSTSHFDGKQRRGVLLICGYAFFSAIVRDGLGPFVAVYLVVARDWSPGQAGALWTLREVASTCGQMPMGTFFDKISNKPMWLLFFTLLSTSANAIITFTDNHWVMIIRSIVGGVAAASIPPGIASITLGLVGPDEFDHVMASTEYANHSGSLFSAIFAGVVAYLCYPDVQYLFLAIAASGVCAMICCAAVPKGVISDELAMNLNLETREVKSKREMLTDASLLLFGLSIMIFHFANAAILPLLGQMMALDNGKEGLPLTGALIVIAQLTSIPSAYAVERFLDCTGYKGAACIGFAHLPIRCALIVLFSKIDDADISRWPLLSTQILDGVGAGYFGLSHVLITRGLTIGTGRFGFSLGFVSACHQAGAGLSNFVGGLMADASYELAFTVLGVVSFLPLIIVPLFVRRIPTPAELRQLEEEEENKAAQSWNSSKMNESERSEVAAQSWTSAKMHESEKSQPLDSIAEARNSKSDQHPVSKMNGSLSTVVSI